MTNSHECLYEFKDAAEFIAFTDWDDVLLGPRLGSFSLGFKNVLELNPLAGSFLVTRLNSYLPVAFSRNNKFSLKRAVQETVYSKRLVDPKVVVKPERVAGVWIHKLILPESSKFTEITIDEKYSIIAHIKNLTYGGGNDSQNRKEVMGNLTDFIDGDVIQQNLQQFFRRQKFEFVSLSNLMLIIFCKFNFIGSHKLSGFQSTP